MPRVTRKVKKRVMKKARAAFIEVQAIQNTIKTLSITAGQMESAMWDELLGAMKIDRDEPPKKMNWVKGEISWTEPDA